MERRREERYIQRTHGMVHNIRQATLALLVLAVGRRRYHPPPDRTSKLDYCTMQTMPKSSNAFSENPRRNRSSAAIFRTVTSCVC